MQVTRINQPNKLLLQEHVKNLTRALKKAEIFYILKAFSSDTTQNIIRFFGMNPRIV